MGCRKVNDILYGPTCFVPKLGFSSRQCFNLESLGNSHQLPVVGVCIQYAFQEGFLA